MAPVNLNTLSEIQLREFFQSIDNILCDNDGVLSVFGALLPGVLNCINKFRDAGKRVKIVTNNSAFGSDLLSKIFLKQGLQCTKDDVITPTCALTNYLKEINFNGKVWLMGFENMKAELEENGFTVAESEDPKIITLSEAQSYITSIDPEIKAIVMDICLNMTSGCIAKAVDYLKKDPSILLLFGSTDAAIPIAKDKLVMGSKYFQDILVQLTNRTPLVFGKPSENFGKYLVEALNCDPARTLFIGDSLEQDIGFAKQMGFQQLLVMTGISKMVDVEQCPDAFKPNYYVNSLEELDLLLSKSAIL